MAIAAYLEMYLYAAVRLAIESDPGVLIGAPGKVDGVVVLKRRDPFDQAEVAEGTVKGTWQTRLANYKRLFGVVPAEVTAAIDELEKLRRFRNAVGHGFGRDFGPGAESWSALSTPAHRVSEDRLKKWLGTAVDVASGVEKHLRSKHIGSYELVRYYHNWARQPGAPHVDHAQKLKKALGIALKQGTPSKQFFKEMVAYYQNVTA